MTAEIEYKLTFKEAPIQLNEDELTFSIGKIKCRTVAVVYFKFYAYSVRGLQIVEYTSPRWVITEQYVQKSSTFTVSDYLAENYDIEDLNTYKIEMYLININSENPLYFNHLQLNEGELKDYHQPNEAITDVSIGFKNNSYVNLYSNDETFLQVIRPRHEAFSTTELSSSQMTILAPHIEHENNFDDPLSLFYEFMYQTEQIIGVEK